MKSFPGIMRSTDGALLTIALVGLVVGGVLHLQQQLAMASLAWAAATLPVLLGLVVRIVATVRHGESGLDVIAALSMAAALAFDEALAGNIVALMYAGGQFLETYAAGRARREMTALLGRVARTAMVYAPDGLREVAIETIVPGDRLFIRQGEVLPVDGTLLGERAAIDASSLTGESVPVAHSRGEKLRSGTVSVGSPFELLALRAAADSTYAAIVRLVEEAQRSKAPFVRLANRYAIRFLGLTIAMAGGAWLWTQDPVRALSVLVVATPCPLILAVPVAVISGISRTARLGILLKSGGALEALGQARVVILDKTGTLTYGRADVSRVWVAGEHDEDEVLRLAASLDQASTHVMADALISAAHARSLRLSTPSDVQETAGEGLVGRVDGHTVAVGGTRFAAAFIVPGGGREKPDFLNAAATVDVVIDGELAGVLVLADGVRADAGLLIRRLRQSGVRRIVLASGDRAAVVRDIGSQLALDDMRSDLSPAAKVDVVLDERRHGLVMMVGDGVNDAPALAAADVGVAMGTRGAMASSEAADVVLLVDRLERLADAMDVARRARTIALQSVFAGLGLSIAAMVVAALGYLPPVQGALLQEGIDIAVIFNALRALRQ